MIRDETPADHAAIAALHRAAFGGSTEARLVEDLRAGGLVVAALVAVETTTVVGHVMFCRVSLEIDGAPRHGASLAPLSVAMSHRGKGIGSSLVAEGLERLAREGVEAVIVLGDPAYYQRFGFSAELASRLVAPFRGEAFMALELVRGALAGERGSVRYPEAFGLGGPRGGPDLT
jgi:putative acetyltransferase